MLASTTALKPYVCYDILRKYSYLINKMCQLASIQMLIRAGGKRKHSIIKPSVKLLVFYFFPWGKNSCILI